MRWAVLALRTFSEKNPPPMFRTPPFCLNNYRSNGSCSAEARVCLISSTQALSVFDVTGLGTGKIDYDSGHIVKSIDQIAKVTEQPADEMKVQFDDVHPRVVGFSKSTPSATNHECWKHTIGKLEKGGNHPIGSIREGAILDAVMGVSSSGVEQHFANTKLKFNDRRQHATADNEEFAIRAIAELPNHDLNQIINTARKIWSILYGPPRKSGGVRASKGMTYKPRQQKQPLGHGMVAHTELEFINKRRSAAAAVAASSSSSSLDYGMLVSIPADHAAQPQWSDSHSKELVFQTKKLHERKLQAVAEGVIDGDDELHEAIKTVKQRRIKDQRARERKQGRDTVKVEGCSRLQLFKRIAGLPTHCLCAKTPELMSAMRQFNMKEVAAVKADVFILDVPGEVGQRVAMITAMRGSHHITPQLVTSRGCLGAGANWKPLSGIMRIIFVSPGALAKNKNAFELLKRILAECKNSVITLTLGKDWNDLVALQRRYSKSQSKLIAIVREVELALPVSPSAVLQC